MKLADFSWAWMFFNSSVCVGLDRARIDSIQFWKVTCWPPAASLVVVPAAGVKGAAWFGRLNVMTSPASAEVTPGVDVATPATPPPVAPALPTIVLASLTNCCQLPAAGFFVFVLIPPPNPAPDG